MRHTFQSRKMMFLQKGRVGECTGHTRVSRQLIAHIRGAETVPGKGEKPNIMKPVDRTCLLTLHMHTLWSLDQIEP
jgi:hypothetical protein